MSSTFHTRGLLTYLFFLGGILFGYAQAKDSLNFKSAKDNSNQKLGYYAINYLNPITSGDNYLGQGTEGNGGFKFGINFFIYEDFFISGNIGANYFTVTDNSITGNYNKGTFSHQYIGLGYQFLTTPKLRSGVTISVFGNSRFKNKGFSGVSREWTIIDNANVRAYEIHIDYLFTSELSINVNYTYRNDKTKIKTAPELQSLFKTASFHNIGFGFKYYFGDKDIINMK